VPITHAVTDREIRRVNRIGQAGGTSSARARVTSDLAYRARAKREPRLNRFGRPTTRQLDVRFVPKAAVSRRSKAARYSITLISDCIICTW
jgi:hypothetical protein